MNTRGPMILLCAVCVLAIGCVGRPSEREMNQLGSELTRLTAAVDAHVRYKGLPDGAFGDDLLLQATAHDPQLLKPFDGHSIRVKQVGGEATVLVCSPDGRHAWLEDLACTPGLDEHRWRTEGPEGCRFTLDVRSLCRP